MPVEMSTADWPLVQVRVAPPLSDADLHQLDAFRDRVHNTDGKRLVLFDYRGFASLPSDIVFRWQNWLQQNQERMNVYTIALIYVSSMDSFDSVMRVAHAEADASYPVLFFKEPDAALSQARKLLAEYAE